MFGWNLVASVVIGIGCVAGSARHASVVERVAVLSTRHATPTTLILQSSDNILFLFDLNFDGSLKVDYLVSNGRSIFLSIDFFSLFSILIIFLFHFGLFFFQICCWQIDFYSSSLSLTSFNNDSIVTKREMNGKRKSTSNGSTVRSRRRLSFSLCRFGAISFGCTVAGWYVDSFARLLVILFAPSRRDRQCISISKSVSHTIAHATPKNVPSKNSGSTTQVSRPRTSTHKKW